MTELGPRPPALLRRLLAALVGDDDWSQEFLQALDADYGRRFKAVSVRSRIWYAGQVVSPKTWTFVKLMWGRRRRAATRDGRLRMGMFDGWMKDLTVGLRTLVRERRFAFFGVVTLALGISGAATMFGIADRIFLRGPAHLTEPEALTRLYLRFDEEQGPRASSWIPWLTVQGIREGTQGFEAVSAFRYEAIPGEVAGLTRTLDVSAVDEHYFSTLGVTPALGRTFDVLSPDDASAAVISFGLWQTEFDGRPDVLGQTLSLRAKSYTVVGVTPERFCGPDLARVDLWIPADLSEATSRNWWVVGRLRDDLSGPAGREIAASQADAAHRVTDPGRFFTWARDGSVVTAPLGYDEAGEEPAEAAVARLLIAVVLLVLLISCANVVNLILARMTRRRQEVAVRLAMGIGRWRLVRALVSESVLLALLASVAALPVVYLAGSSLRRLLLPNVAWSSSPLEPRVLGVMVLLSLVLGALAGVLPARSAGRVDVQQALRSGDPNGGGRARLRIHTLLATGQVTLAVTLMVCAGLLFRSFWTLRTTDLGFDADQVVAVELASLEPNQLDPNTEAESEAIARAMIQLQTDPRVESAAMVIGVPFIQGFSKTLTVVGWDSIPALPGGGPWLSAVGPDYFRTAGTAIRRGRGIEPGDEPGSVVVVSESMAELLWSGRDPIGDCIGIGNPEEDCHRVVGVVADVHRAGYREPPSMQFYVPWAQTLGIGGTMLLVRPRPGVSDLPAHLEATLRRVAPGVDLVTARTLGSFLEAEVRPWRMGTIALGLSALLATLVAVLGVYGVLSYLVAQRQREIGVRIALGAPAAAVRTLVLRSGMGAAVVGIVFGSVLVIPAAPWLRPLLYQTSIRDPWVMAGVPALILAAALAACLIPARQATRIPPASCLRSE